MREEGYYWVRVKGGKPRIFEWSDGAWWSHGSHAADTPNFKVLSGRLEPPQLVTEKG